jgi:uncharacterized protein (TIGR02270 family)
LADNTANDHVLWDVMEEHFDEAQYACEELEVQLSHATLSLQDVQENIEARLIAHVDGLVLGGDLVARQLLATAFDADDPPEPSRTVAGAYTLMQSGQPKLAAAGLLSSNAGIRSATLRGVSLAGAKILEPWALDRFREHKEPELRATLLPLVAARLEPEVLLGFLRRDQPAALASAAVRAVTWEPRGNDVTAVESLLGHEAAEVRRAALYAGLARGSARAWSDCTKRALSGDANEAESLALFAALSRSSQDAGLVKLLDREEVRASGLFALGFTGDREMVPVLLEYVAGEDRTLARIAAQSIQLITGLDTQADEYVLPIPPPGDPKELAPPEEDPEASESLPAIDEDDLEASLVPIPEAAMPDPDAAAIRKQWEKLQSAFAPQHKYVLGQPLSVASLLDALEHGRMRIRSVLALALAIRTGGQCWLDARMLIRDQRARLAELRGLQVRSFARQFGYT